MAVVDPWLLDLGNPCRDDDLHPVIWDDFHFGKAMRGNFAMLKEKGKLYGLSVEDTRSYQVAGLRISSTLIRDALGEKSLSSALSQRERE
jgi:FAD synthase